MVAGAHCGVRPGLHSALEGRRGPACRRKAEEQDAQHHHERVAMSISCHRRQPVAARHDTTQRATADGKRTANSLRRRALHRLDVIGFWRC